VGNTKFYICGCNLSVAVAVLLLLSTDSLADFFKYKDADGNLIITNRFEDVPQKYRSKVKVIWDKDLESKDPVARKRAAAKEQLELKEAGRIVQQEAEDKKKAPANGKTLVIELDERSGQIIRRFE